MNIDMPSMVNLGANQSGETNINTSDILTSQRQNVSINKLLEGKKLEFERQINIPDIINSMSANKKIGLFTDCKSLP